MDVTQALALIETPGGDPLMVMHACETLVAFAHARQLAAIIDLAEEQQEGYDTFGQLVDPVPAEIATALRWTGWTASKRVDLAHDLHDNLPDLLEALRSGTLDLAKATEIATGTCELAPGDRLNLAGRAVAYAARHTRAQLRAWLSIQVAKIDPEACEKRRKRATKHRRVWVQPEAGGMATLGAYLAAEEAQSCYESLRGAARNHEGEVDGARADVFVERLTGIAPGEPIPVTVIVTPTGPQLAGYGPLSDQHTTRLCGQAPRIQLHKPAPTPAYSPTAALRRWVQARDRHCRFPGCRRPATQCDLDHTVPGRQGFRTLTTCTACADTTTASRPTPVGRSTATPTAH